MRVRDRVLGVGLFLLVFGGFMGLLVWKAGGVVPEGQQAPDTADPGDDPGAAGDTFTRVPGRGVQVGEGKGAVFKHGSVEVIGSERIPYTSWRATAESSRPGDAEQPDVRHLIARGLSMWIYARPTAEQPSPRAVEGPGAYRIDAREADLQHHPSEEQDDLTAELMGDVVVTWFLAEPRDAMPGQRTDIATLTSQALSLGVEKQGVASARTLSTQEPVRVDIPGLTLDGTGLECILADRRRGSVARIDILRDVRAAFLVRDGALRADGGTVSTVPVMSTVTCTGKAQMVSLEGRGELASGKWRATFHENVRVEQEGVLLTCDKLLVDFYMRDLDRGPDGVTESLPVELFHATGNVVLDGTREGDVYRIESGSAKSFKTTEGDSLVEFDGGVRCEFSPKPPENDRASEPVPTVVRIRSRKAVLKAKPREQHELEQSRVYTDFIDEVVVRQVDRTSGDVLSEMTAPLLKLIGNRHAVDGRYEPEYMVGSGGVVLTREAFEANALTARWTTDPKFGTETIQLNGRPAVTFHGGSPHNPWGQATGFMSDGSFVLTAVDEIAMTINQAEATADGQRLPYATVQATRDTVLRKLVGERETLRLSAAKLNANFDADRRIDYMAAAGNAKLTGQGEDARARRAEAAGAMITVRREVGQQVPADEWVGTATIRGGSEPGSLTIFEPDGSRHQVRAPVITTAEGGSLIVAKGGAQADIELAEKTSGDGRAVGPIRLTARQLRAHLTRAPTGEDAQESAKKQTAELRSIEAESNVRLIGSGFTVTGRKLSFDAITGLAESEGDPAFVEFASAPGLEEYKSYVRSRRIRAFVDMRDAHKGELIRASCVNGYIVRYLVADTPPGGTRPTPERVTVRAQGTIDVEPTRGRAVQDVVVTYENALSPTRFEKDVELRCDSLDLEFDSAGKGDLANRIRRTVARAEGDRQVRVTGRGLDATAHRVEGTGADQVMKLFAGGGRKVWVKRDDPDTGFTALASEFLWNFRTEEFEIFAAEYLED